MIKAKKSLGQNFLIDRNILEKIVEITNIKNKSILEVGPGTGNLTSFILKKKPKKFYVIEKDENLITELKEKFNNEVFVINEDILNLNEKNLSNEKLTVFGNLPYNISTEILAFRIVGISCAHYLICSRVKSNIISIPPHNYIFCVFIGCRHAYIHFS